MKFKSNNILTIFFLLIIFSAPCYAHGPIGALQNIFFPTLLQIIICSFVLYKLNNKASVKRLLNYLSIFVINLFIIFENIIFNPYFKLDTIFKDFDFSIFLVYFDAVISNFIGYIIFYSSTKIPKRKIRIFLYILVVFFLSIFFTLLLIMIYSEIYNKFYIGK